MSRGDTLDGRRLKVRTNAEWLEDLRAAGEAQDAALEDLRGALLRAARYALQRGRARLGRETAVDELAEECAQEALVAILARLDGFRGDSRFTTWAYAFAVNVALVAARRESWRHVSLDALLEGGRVPPRADEATDADPERAARRAEAWRIVREVIDEQLTDRQRAALTAIALDEVPLDELARHWGSNRNALYKLLHDARRRAKAALQGRGFAPKDVLALFGDTG
jgi:RNA polymerase sigma-70 factor (ECF subfamily)